MVKKTAAGIIALLLLAAPMGGTVNAEVQSAVTASAAASAEDTQAYDIDYLVLVNKQSPLPDDWEDKVKLVHTKNSQGDDVAVEKKTYSAYRKLRSALEKEGIHIDLDSGYRSVAEQQRIVEDFTERYGEDYVKQYVAVPGYSEHHTGLALDLYLNVNGKDVVLNEDLVKYPKIWAKIHAKLADYGFILRFEEGKEDITGYSYEPWHIRYVGKKAAKQITSKGITLEEYPGLAYSSGRAALSLWTADSEPAEALISYVEAVTDKNSPDYIPEKNRIAVFDFDGTLFCETDPNYFDYCLLEYRVLGDPDYKDKASDFERETAKKIRELNKTGKAAPGLEIDHGKAVASAFSGMTIEQFNAYVRRFKKRSMPNYSGMKRGDGYYKPMVQIVNYLQANGFTVYVVSGTDRFIVRNVLANSPIDLPQHQIIGSDETVVASHQGDAGNLEYVYRNDDKLILGGEFVTKNLKMNKVAVIAQEIGEQPVLSFGNSTGDSSMAEYTITNNKYRSLAFMLCCDDTERENGNIEKADKMYALCEENGWIPVSMKNDWLTIYGSGVKYKGSSK